MKVKIGKLEPDNSDYNDEIQGLEIYDPNATKQPFACKEYKNKFAWFPVSAECSSGNGTVYIIWLRKYREVSVYIFGAWMKMCNIIKNN